MSYTHKVTLFRAGEAVELIFWDFLHGEDVALTITADGFGLLEWIDDGSEFGDHVIVPLTHAEFFALLAEIAAWE